MRETIAKRLRSLRSLYIDVPPLRPGTVGAYALACVPAGVAAALRLVLDPYVEGAQFVTFYPAIVITTLISGFGAGFFLRRAQHCCGRLLRVIATLVFLP